MRKPTAKSTKPEAVPLESKDAPFIHFDASPNYGFHDGVANITIEATRQTIEDGKIKAERVVVAYLRCGLGALMNLKQAIDGVEAIVADQPRFGQMN